MKTEKIEQLMLLEQSGELGLIGRWQLRRARATQPELQTFSDDLTTLTNASRSSGISAMDLPPSVLGAIRQAAAEQSQQTVSLEAVYGSWLRPAIALAAIFVAVLGIGVVNHLSPSAPLRVASVATHTKWDDSLDTELNNLSSMLSLNFDASVDHVAMDENALARELLSLEGTQQ